jgi:hypothetical protein
MDVPSRENRTEDDSPGEKDEFTPRGVIVFLALMLFLYAAYWAYLWYVVTIQRGIGG